MTFLQLVKDRLQVYIERHVLIKELVDNDLFIIQEVDKQTFDQLTLITHKNIRDQVKTSDKERQKELLKIKDYTFDTELMLPNIDDDFDIISTEVYLFYRDGDKYILSILDTSDVVFNKIKADNNLNQEDFEAYLYYVAEWAAIRSSGYVLQTHQFLVDKTEEEIKKSELLYFFKLNRKDDGRYCIISSLDNIHLGVIG